MGRVVSTARVAGHGRESGNDGEMGEGKAEAEEVEERCLPVDEGDIGVDGVHGEKEVGGWHRGMAEAGGG